MQHRKPRKDKGQPRWTERDLWVLPWIGEQYIVRFDQLLGLLSQQPLGETLKDGWVGEATVRHWMERWKKAGMIASASILAGHPSWVWLTVKGLRTVGLEFRMWTPNPGRLRHLYYCNEVRAIIESEGNDPVWYAERELRAEQAEVKKGVRANHLPDAEVEIKGKTIAIEVELSIKEQERLRAILYDLERRYAGIRYFVLPSVKPHIEQAIGSLLPEFMRQKFSVVVLEETWE